MSDADFNKIINLTTSTLFTMNEIVQRSKIISLFNDNNNNNKHLYSTYTAALCVLHNTHTIVKNK